MKDQLSQIRKHASKNFDSNWDTVTRGKISSLRDLTARFERAHKELLKFFIKPLFTPFLVIFLQLTPITKYEWNLPINTIYS